MRTGLKTLISGIVLVVITILVVPALFLMAIMRNEPPETPFQAPGEVVVRVEEPGRYYIWNDFRTFREGRSYERPDTMPDGTTIIVRNEAGETLDFTADGWTTSTRAERARRSVGYVEVTRPETLAVSVTGVPSEFQLTFVKSDLKRLWMLISGGFATTALLVIGGIGMVVRGIVKLGKSKRIATAM